MPAPKGNELLKLSQLKLNSSNPRFIKDERFKKLVKSIQEFPKMMELRPIIYDPSNFEILGGNMRFRALKELGYKEIPKEWVKSADELTDEEKKRFIIEDNIGFGEWDYDILANDWNEEELKDWGLDLPVFDEIVYQDDDGMSKSNDRGGFSSDGIKIQIGNFTKFIKNDDILYNEFVDIQDNLLNSSEFEKK